MRASTFAAALLALLIPAATFAADAPPPVAPTKSITVVADAGKPLGDVTVRVQLTTDDVGTQIASVELTLASGAKLSVPKDDLKWSHLNLGSITVAGDSEKLHVILRDIGAEWTTVTRFKEVQTHFAYRQITLSFADGKFVKRADETVIVKPPFAIPTDPGAAPLTEPPGPPVANSK